MKFQYQLLALVLVLTGCSFTTHLSIDTKNSDRARPAGHAASSAVSDCDVYVPPTLGDVPDVPVAEISAVPPSEHSRKEAILVDHIKRLRAQITADRKAVAENYMTYLASCK